MMLAHKCGGMLPATSSSANTEGNPRFKRRCEALDLLSTVTRARRTGFWDEDGKTNGSQQISKAKAKKNAVAATLYAGRVFINGVTSRRSNSM